MKKIDAVPGIAGARLWDVPLKADLYHEEMLEASERDPIVAFIAQNGRSSMHPLMSRELS